MIRLLLSLVDENGDKMMMRRRGQDSFGRYCTVLHTVICAAKGHVAVSVSVSIDKEIASITVAAGSRSARRFQVGRSLDALYFRQQPRWNTGRSY